MIEIKLIIKNALQKAMINEPFENDNGKLHKERSKRFVEELADEFRKEFPVEKKFRVFSKHFNENRYDFGLNELLYDILVCETDSVLSASRKYNLFYIKNAKYMIESEFDESNSKAILIDFNKLVLGNAEVKILVTSRTGDTSFFIEPLKAPAEYCNGDIFIASVPHPKKWADDMNINIESITVFKYDREKKAFVDIEK